MPKIIAYDLLDFRTNGLVEGVAICMFEIFPIVFSQRESGLDLGVLIKIRQGLPTAPLECDMRVVAAKVFRTDFFHVVFRVRFIATTLFFASRFMRQTRTRQWC
jgi:hypothetical protein